MESRILHVEDNPDDVVLIDVACRRAGIRTRLEVAADGDQAIAALQNGSGNNPPDCVLLDFKLHGKSGLEVLAWIRSQPRLKRLPVIFLTSSCQPADVNRAYDLGANSFLVKPSDLPALVELVKTIDHYWVQSNVHPT